MIELVQGYIDVLRKGVIDELNQSIGESIKIKKPFNNRVCTNVGQYELILITKDGVTVERYNGYKSWQMVLNMDALMLESLVHVLDIVKNGEKITKTYEIG